MLCSWSQFREQRMTKTMDDVFIVIATIHSGYHEFYFIVDGIKTISTMHPRARNGLMNSRVVLGPPSQRLAATAEKSGTTNLSVLVEQTFCRAMLLDETSQGSAVDEILQCCDLASTMKRRRSNSDVAISVTVIGLMLFTYVLSTWLLAVTQAS